MNSWGLNARDVKWLRDTFAQFPEITEVRIFGSRAMGNFKPGSDVDLALFGKGRLECTTRVSGMLNEELPLPYQFDVVDYSAVTNPDLLAHIDQHGQQIYLGKIRKADVTGRRR